MRLNRNQEAIQLMMLMANPKYTDHVVNFKIPDPSSIFWPVMYWNMNVDISTTD